MAKLTTNPSNTIIPGDFLLHDIFLSSPFNNRLSIKEIMEEINIYESVFKHTLTGNIAISDTNNILVDYPIVGYETITLIFDNPTIEASVPVEKDFRVYNISQYTPVGEQVAGYVINFVSEETITNSQTKISQSYMGKNISNIVQTIYEDYVDSEKPLVVEETRNIHDVIIPNWSPFYSMNWLSSRGISETYNGANYFFFETLEGFNFVSLEGLIDEVRMDKDLYPEGTKMHYTYQMKNVSENPAQINPEAFRNASDYKVDRTFNVLQNLSLGMYGSKLITHDIVRRSYKEYDFDYKETYDDYIHLEENTNSNVTSGTQQSTMLQSETVDDFTEKYNSYRMMIPSHYQLYGGIRIPNRNTSHHERSIQSRVSQLQQLNTYKLILTVPGDPLRRSGDLIYFEYPNTAASDDGKVTEDKLYSGNYMVLGVRNRFVKEFHETILELVKDSYFTPLRKELL
jgi:hypothetical protein